MYTTLITADELRQLIQQGHALQVFDCSYELTQPKAGREQYETVHICGAHYADLDTALSDKRAGAATASGGRHPLPTPERFAQWLTAVGVNAQTQVVVYDRQNSGFCGRLWWMLKWVGHEAVAVLDGGLAAWQGAGGAVDSGAGPAAAVPADPPFKPTASKARLLTVDQVAQGLGQPGQTLIDARAQARYRGEVEPLDPVAGHIPGALNRPLGLNMLPDGRFKPAEQLRQEFQALLGPCDPASVVHQCGSGVSANVNLLAMEIAGLGRAPLFAGSWSQWCSDPARPVSKG
jgi:thiosulfate/3-mercaptopyruvate sulfurtransferase